MRTPVAAPPQRQALRWSLAATVALGLAACGWLTPQPAPLECGFPEGTALAFSGETTLAQLRLDEQSNFAQRVGQIYVTRDKIPFTGSVPMTPNGPAVVPDFRHYCALLGDGATVIGGAPDDWAPPSR